MLNALAVVVITCVAAASTARVDVSALWDFGNPALSEQRFRAALATAEGDDALILQTQIARTWALRGQFDKARAVLRGIEPGMGAAGPEARVRYWLELGRTHASHRHPPASQTAASRGEAHAAFGRALALSRQAGLDALAVDAAHMHAFADTAPAGQVRWGKVALSIVEASTQADARKWEASIRSNLGEALHELGRHDEALAHFRRALALREAAGNRAAARDARWHVARVLRVQGHVDQALALQRQVERDSDALGDARHYVYEELALLYRALGDGERATRAQARAGALKK